MFAGSIKPTVPSNPVAFRYRAGNCILITIAIICACILVACGVVIVREYALGVSYIPTICRISNVTHNRNLFLKCQYCSMKEKGKQKGKGTCTDTSFPCIQVLVNYNTKDGKSLQGKLHQDSLQARGQYRECSYHVCEKSKQENTVLVEKFADQWRTRYGKQMECFYNTEDTSSVIEHKNYTKSQVIHSMFWPSLIIFICGVIFLRLEMTRRGLTFCGVQDETLYGGASVGKSSSSIRGGGGGYRGGNKQSNPAAPATARNAYSGDVNEKNCLLAKKQQEGEKLRNNRKSNTTTSTKNNSINDKTIKTADNKSNLNNRQKEICTVPCEVKVTDNGTSHKLLDQEDGGVVTDIPAITINRSSGSFGSKKSLTAKV